MRGNRHLEARGNRYMAMTKTTEITTAQPSPTPIACVRCGARSPFPMCNQCDGITQRQRDVELSRVVRKVVRR